MVLKKYPLKTLLILFTTLLSEIAFAQISISGKVYVSGSKEPVIGAHVFINQTTQGTVTDVDGNFELNGIKDEQQLLVITAIGFENFSSSIKNLRSQKQPLIIELKEDIRFMNEIVVKEKKPKQWLKDLAYFEEVFLGVSPVARKATITNKYQLEFSRENGIFEAFSPEPLVIVHPELGYEITYHLKEFKVLESGSIYNIGFSRFKELKSEDENEKEVRKWHERRQEQYSGSFKHFMDALIENKLEEEGFQVFYIDNRLYTDSAPRVMNPSEILRRTLNLNQVELFNRKSEYLMIVYLKEEIDRELLRRMGIREHRFQTSYIQLPRGKAVIQRKTGQLEPPYLPVLYGYWGWTNRLGDLLPGDYN